MEWAGAERGCPTFLAESDLSPSSQPDPVSPGGSQGWATTASRWAFPLELI